jgi:hypothetical protein
MTVQRERFFAAIVATALAGMAPGCNDEPPAPAPTPEPSVSPAQPEQPQPQPQAPEAVPAPAEQRVGPTVE